MNKNQILDLRIEVLAADPSGAGLYEGRLWFNSTDDLLKYYDGAQIVELGVAETGGVQSFTVDGSTIEDIGTGSDPNIRLKVGGIENIHISDAAAIDLAKLAVNPLA